MKSRKRSRRVRGGSPRRRWQSAPSPSTERPALFRNLWWIAIPVGVGLLLRGVHLGFVVSEPVLLDSLVLDSELFAKMASAIGQGDVFAGPDVFSVGPLYAYLLAGMRTVVGASNSGIFALQAVVGLGSIALVTLLARRLAGNRAACIAGLAYAAYAPAVMLETKILGETFAVFFALFSSFLLGLPETRKRLWFAGASFGAASLLRSDLLSFVPLGIAWLALPEGMTLRPFRPKTVRARAALAWAIPLFALVLSATLRNAVVTGQPVLVSSQAGISFYQGNNPRAEGAFSIPAGFSGDKRLQEREARAFAERETGRTLSVSEVDRYWFGRGVSYLVSHPGDALVLAFRKLRYWTNSDELSGEYSVLSERCFAPSLGVAFVPFGLFLAAFVVAAQRVRRSAPRFGLLLGLIIVSNLGTCLLFFVSSRYRLVAAAHLAVFVGPAVDEIRSWWAARRTNRPPLGRAALAVAVFALSLVSWTDAVRFQAAKALYNLGGKQYENHRYDEAISYYLSAVEVRPNDEDLRFNLGQAYAMVGDYARAASELERALSLNPTSKENARYLEQYRREARGAEPSARSYGARCHF